MKITCASDIHGDSKALMTIGVAARDEGSDCILIAGDICINQVLRNFASLLHDLAAYAKCPIILTPGNHDYWKPEKIFPKPPGLVRVEDIYPQQSVFCLVDEAITYKGWKFYGSPWTEQYGNWNWQKSVSELTFGIPSDTDVLITHSPPFGYGDIPSGTEGRIGNKALAEAVKNTPNLQLHVFGHAHVGGWQGHINSTLLVNGALMDDNLNFNVDGITTVHFDFDLKQCFQTPHDT